MPRRRSDVCYSPTTWDFARLGKEVDHAGIVEYVTQELAPGPFVQAIRRLDRHFSPTAMKNNIEWLDDWLR